MKAIYTSFFILTSILAGTTCLCQDVEVYDTFDAFSMNYMQAPQGDTVSVVNFWATWCVPCVKELPYFEQLLQEQRGKPFKQVLVSLDDPRKIEDKLLPFMSEKKIQSHVVLLADSKTYKWIDKVDPSWSGAIPITVIFKGGKKHFFERDFHSTDELKDLISTL